MKKKFLVLIVLVLTISLKAQDRGDLIPVLKQELDYNMRELKKQDLPPYYMSFRVEDVYQADVASDFGHTFRSKETRLRSFVPQIRLGNKELDNFKYNTQGAPGGGQQRKADPIYIPLSDGFADGIRTSIWQEVTSRYNFACRAYEQVKSEVSTRVEDEDKSPCFSDAPVESYYEAPLPDWKIKLDIDAWEKKLNEVTTVFKSCPELQYATASIDFQVKRIYFVNTDGTEVAQNRIAARVMLSAQLKADDGMELPLNKDYFSFDLDSLPGTARMIADAKDMVVRLRNLRYAPVADPYTGPAILSGAASGVFFHEIFGHRLEGHRLKKGGETFKKMVGQSVLPKDFQVFCDPTLRNYAGTDLNGFYLYDDEGVKSRRVNNVVDGVLKEFLLSRIPLDGFPVSNGHGRCSGVNDPVARQSNLIIETKAPYTDAELRKMLIEEAKKQGKEYGYFFKTVTSGFTFTGEGGSLNSFNVTPLEVYRVFVDGRPDQLVRGVDMIGTPLTMFSNIVAAGNKPSVFTGSCGAESGWVPVTASSPEIYVSQIETQRRQQSRSVPPLLPAPAFKDTLSSNVDDAILAAMRDELARSQQHLALQGAERPFYYSYLASHYHQFQIIADMGGVQSSVFTPWRMTGGVQLLVGNFKRNSEAQPGQYFPANLPSEPDYSNIRRSYWASSDMAYQYALQSYSQKMSYLKANPLSKEREDMMEMQRLAPVTKIEQPKRIFEVDKAKLEQIAAELSGIFVNYKELHYSSVEITGSEMNYYRYTSERVELKQPLSNVHIRVSATLRFDDGSNVRDFYDVVVANPADLPSLETLKADVITFADNLMKQKEAPIVEEDYSGPVLLEDEATADILAGNLLGKDGLIAYGSLFSNNKTLEDKVGKKIIDPSFTILNYSDMAEYEGVPLMGCYTTDADGVTPEPVQTLVEKGVLKKLLNDRYPTLKTSMSTGSSRFSNRVGMVGSMASIGTLHIKGEGGIERAKMKKELLRAAKSKKLKVAYIIRCPKNCTSMQIFRVDIKTGEETLVRTSALTLPSLEKMTKLVAVSSEENVMNRDDNCNTSLIYPAAIIVPTMEIGKADFKIMREPVLPYPLQRK